MAGSPPAGLPTVARPTARRRAGLRGAPVAAATLLLLMVAVAVGADVLAPYSPIEVHMDLALRPPWGMAGGLADHPFGTDALGRDILSRVMFGARLAAGGDPVDRVRGSRGHRAGPGRRLRRRRHGRDPHAHGGRGAHLPRPPPRPDLRGHRGPEPLGGHGGAGPRAVVALRAPRARRGAELQGAGLHRLRAGRGRLAAAHRARARAAEHRQQHRRPRHAAGRLRHRRGGLAELPRRRRAADPPPPGAA